MPTGYQIDDQKGLYFLTLQVVEWIDVFTRKTYCDIVIENLQYCQEHKNFEIYAFVIMSNHVHLLAKSGVGDLSGTIRDFKSYTSKKILKEITQSTESRKKWMLEIFAKSAEKHKRNFKYQFWTHENHAEHIYSNKFISQKVKYIHNNPVKSGIVGKAEEYIYSSAKNYAKEKGVMDVELLILPWNTYS